MTRRGDYDEVAVAQVVSGVRMRLTHDGDVLEACRRMAARGTVSMEQAAELMSQSRDRIQGLCTRNGIRWPRAAYPLDWVHSYLRNRALPAEPEHATLERRARALRPGIGDRVRVRRTEGRDRTYVGRVTSVNDDGVSVCVSMPLSRGNRERWDAPAHYPMDRVIQVPWWRIVDVVQRAAA